MSIENAFAWTLVGISLVIALVAFAVIVACVWRRVAEHRTQGVLRRAMQGGDRA